MSEREPNTAIRRAAEQWLLAHGVQLYAMSPEDREHEIHVAAEWMLTVVDAFSR